MAASGNTTGASGNPRAKSSNTAAAEQEVRYDRERVVSEVLAITTHYAGPFKEKQGCRRRFRCPECGKELLDVNTDTFVTGCWNQDCGLPESDTAIGFIAHLENLDTGAQFKEVLRRGYEAAAIQPESVRNQSPSPTTTAAAQDGGRTADAPAAGSGADTKDTGTKAFAGADEMRQRSTAGPNAAAPTEQELDLADRVYSYIMSLCKLEKHHLQFWRERGLNDETIAAARLGSISQTRCSYLLRRIKKEFTEEQILSVPGFFKNDAGLLSFTFFEELTLIPYHDGRGRISTLEGRVLVDKPKKGGKYRSLRESHNHVYIFPGTDPNELQAYCEGPIGAIAAAQEGLAVGAIQGYRRYKGRPRFQGDERPPPEVEGADFGGRMVPFIPDVDDPPQQHVLDEAPETARILTALQNGRPATVRLPHGKDLDQYLMARNKVSRKPSLLKLLRDAHPTAAAAEGSEDDASAQEPSATQTGATGNTGAATGNAKSDTTQTQPDRRTGEEPTTEHEPAVPDTGGANSRHEATGDDAGQTADTARVIPLYGLELPTGADATHNGRRSNGQRKTARNKNANIDLGPATNGSSNGHAPGSTTDADSTTGADEDHGGEDAQEQAELTHQARRPKENPDPDDPERWTRSVYDDHRQPLPSDARLTPNEALGALTVFAAIWGALFAIFVAGYILCRYLAAAVWAPEPLAAVAAALAHPALAIAAFVLTTLAALLAGAVFAHRTAALRKDRRNMLQGKIKW